METSGAVLRRSTVGFRGGIRRDAGDRSFGTSVACPRRGVGVSLRPSGVSGGGNGFSDDGHLLYYLPQVRCGVRKKEKKRARLVKGLSKDLSAFYSMGFGIETGEGMVGEVKGKMISEAAELLLVQLKQLRAEEKELKRKRKQEKAARMKNCADDDTSSSSSESSDSDCETVVRMSNLRTSDLTEPKPDVRAALSPKALIYNQPPLSLETTAEDGIELNHISSKPGLECSSSSISATLGCSKSSSVVVGKGMDRIEVCMGGKCMKSGASDLLAEFERRVGVEGAVVGCKCMGKCRDAPNVRVLNSGNEEDAVRASRNPLCIGVGLEDVGAIVANFFGEQKDVGLLAA